MQRSVVYLLVILPNQAFGIAGQDKQLKLKSLLPKIGIIKLGAKLFHIPEEVSHCSIPLHKRSTFIPESVNGILHNCHKSPAIIRQVAPQVKGRLIEAWFQ